MVATYYASGFTIVPDPFGGAKLLFVAHSPGQAPPGQPIPLVSDEQVAVGMSLQHLKIMSYLLARQVITFERERGPISIGEDLLKTPHLNIALTAWHAFWGSSPKGAGVFIPVEDNGAGPMPAEDRSVPSKPLRIERD